MYGLPLYGKGFFYITAMKNMHKTTFSCLKEESVFDYLRGIQ